MPWGIGAVGSALEWHSRGHGFKSRILHYRQKSSRTRNPFKTEGLRVFYMQSIFSVYAIKYAVIQHDVTRSAIWRMALMSEQIPSVFVAHTRSKWLSCQDCCKMRVGRRSTLVAHHRWSRPSPCEEMVADARPAVTLCQR